MLHPFCPVLQEAYYLERYTSHPRVLSSLKARQALQRGGGVDAELQQFKCEPALKRLLARDLTQLDANGLHEVAREVALQEWAAQNNLTTYEVAQRDLQEDFAFEVSIPDSIRDHIVQRLKQQEDRERARYDRYWGKVLKRGQPSA